jgi:hypothetical protein
VIAWPLAVPSKKPRICFTIPVSFVFLRSQKVVFDDLDFQAVGSISWNDKGEVAFAAKC